MIRQMQQKIWGYKIRELITGEHAEEYKDATDLDIHTRCPEKWLLIDLETGQMYRGMKSPGPYGKWRRLQRKFKIDAFND